MLWLQDSSGNDFIGKVWPGLVVFPDYFNPDAFSYWQKEVIYHNQSPTINYVLSICCCHFCCFFLKIGEFLNLLPVDGLWLDMNEISNFCAGECETGFLYGNQKLTSQCLPQCPGFDPQSPPYAINNQGNNKPLNTHTIDMTAVHHGGVLEYNAHNLYGLLYTM